MSGPIDADRPDVQNADRRPASTSAAIDLDLGAAWTEGARSFVLEPVTLELGSVLSASARISLGNVPREVFSTNPLQAAFMAAQIEAGTVEITLRDIGGVDLAVAQYARTQNVSPDEARRAIIDNIKADGAAMATTNPDADGDRGRAGALYRDPARHADHQAHAPGQGAGDAVGRGAEDRSARRAGAVSGGGIDGAVS